MKKCYIETSIRIRWCFMTDGCSITDVNRRDSLLAAFVAAIWGINFVVIDWGMDGVPPLLFLTCRFVLVVFPAIFFLPRPDAPWRTLAAVGCFMSLGQFGFLYGALAAGLPPGLAALILQAQVIFTVVIAAVTLRERPRSTQFIGVLVGSFGLVIVGLGRGGHVPVRALGLCLLGAFSWGIGNVVSRSSGVSGGLALTVWSALFVPIPAFLLAFLVSGPDGVLEGLQAFGWKATVSTIYTAAMASMVGYGIFNTLLSRNPSAAVVPWVLLAPVVAMTSAAVFLSQVPTIAEAAGGAVMVGGVLVALRAPARAGAAAGFGAEAGESDADLTAPV
jgi:O-acetylserine/cysteine efflux transporter